MAGICKEFIHFFHFCSFAHLRVEYMVRVKPRSPEPFSVTRLTEEVDSTPYGFEINKPKLL